ncbi:MAG: hypothetical protein QNJ81_03275 [Acidimicrobiia bacterium]|nr:hypothetical protein [Acidimicrobiia bacterium]
MVRRLSITAILAALVLTLAPGIAPASVTGECTGEATIKGVTYTPANDTPSNAIPIPNERGVQVTYSGSVGFANTNHSGVAKVQVGPFNITLAEPWRDPNTADQRSVQDQIYELDDFRDKLPIWIPGVWKVTATHSADGGSCSGFAMIELEGNPLSNVVGWLVLIGLIGTGYWLISAIVRKHPVSAAFAALLFGFLLSLALMMWKIRPLDTFTTVVLPIVLAFLAALAVIIMSRSSTTA